MIIETNLSQVLKEFCYVSNHHYVKLTDKEGHTARLDATAVLRCECLSCKAEFIVLYNSGRMRCPHCGGESKARWGSMQLAFVPEEESQLKANVKKRKP